MGAEQSAMISDLNNWCSSCCGKDQKNLISKSSNVDLENARRGVQRSARDVEVLDILKQGGVLRQISSRDGHGKNRFVWLSADMEAISWCSVKQEFIPEHQRSLKGSMDVAELTSIEDGCDHAKKQDHAFTMVAGDRCVYFEAEHQLTASEWIEGLLLLLDMNHRVTGLP